MAPLSGEEFHAEAGLQGSDLLADRARRDVQFRGRGTDMPEAGYRFEDPEGVQGR
ncbi:hypothetical protein D3C85_1859430 [compost metagenome]